MLILPTEAAPTWLLVRTKPKQERAASEVLASRGLESYFPRVIEPRWHRRAPRGPVPLFPSYVFARCIPSEQFAAVNYCTGVAGVVRFGDHVAAVGDVFIAALREREGERGYVVYGDVRRRLEKGTKVRVISGPLAGLEGVVTNYAPASERVRLLLSVVSSVRTVEVDTRAVRCA